MLDNQMHELAKSLWSVLVHLGVLRKDSHVTGPELLLAAETYLKNDTNPALALLRDIETAFVEASRDPQHPCGRFYDQYQLKIRPRIDAL
jgi:hypothetical protein